MHSGLRNASGINPPGMQIGDSGQVCESTHRLGGPGTGLPRSWLPRTLETNDGANESSCSAIDVRYIAGMPRCDDVLFGVLMALSRHLLGA